MVEQYTWSSSKVRWNSPLLDCSPYVWNTCPFIFSTDPLKVEPVRFCFLKNWFPFPFFFAGAWVCPSVVGLFGVFEPLSLILTWFCTLVLSCTGLAGRFKFGNDLIRTAATCFRKFQKIFGNSTYVAFLEEKDGKKLGPFYVRRYLI